MQTTLSLPGISVIMPVFNYASFLSRAVTSLREQSFASWELIIINDGSTDNTFEVIQSLLPDSRIKYVNLTKNRGMGYCLNRGIDAASFDFIAYLPADDVFYKDHLKSLLEKLIVSPDAVLAYSGVRHHYNRSATGMIDGVCLQLVQVLHRKSEERWLEREELVTDDLDRMFWDKLRPRGKFIPSAMVSCEWVDHPHQRHKTIQEPVGGINAYKLRYGVNHPLRYHSTRGNSIDEVTYYSRFKTLNTKRRDGLKILLVGELAYNAERILALEEQGHQLFGLWMREPYWYNYVGPLPFGNVTDIPYENWEEEVRRIQPDIIYALLNWQAVPFAHQIMKGTPEIPFVWHFKEGPFICLEKGMWNEMIELYAKSDGQIYCSEEMRLWTEQFLPPSGRNSMILDGDLPKREWFSDDVSSKISTRDKAFHTVVPGRPIGLHPHTVVTLAEQNIHLHFYGDFTHGQWKEWIEKTQRMAPGFLHIHPNCAQDKWVREFSQYDAGWLHFFKSENGGELMRMNWDDLNIPARMATLAVAGLPMLQFHNDGHLVATQTLARKYGLSIFIDDIKNLASHLADQELMSDVSRNVWQHREVFMFDHHVEKLIAFFKATIEKRKAAARLDASNSYDTLAENAIGSVG